LEDPDEQEEVKELLAWWNRWVSVPYLQIHSLLTSESTQPNISELFDSSTPCRKAQRSGEDKGKACCAKGHYQQFLRLMDGHLRAGHVINERHNQFHPISFSNFYTM
jgi:hypothetical protein